ncbi:MAG: LolA family protein [bacterium]
MTSLSVRVAHLIRLDVARATLALALVAATPCAAHAQSEAAKPAPNPASPPSAPTPTDAPKPDAAKDRAEAFLVELEKTSSTIASMSGMLTLEKYDGLSEESDQRTGRLVLDRKDGKRRIAIRFEEYIDGSGRIDRSILHYIVAEGWLCEIDHTNKSFTKRQIARPGEDFDPLAIGNGPVPLPIGQKKADVLARFDVTETEIPSDIPLLGSLQDVAALRLIPKVGSEAAKDLDNIDLFYDRTTLAPVGVVLREKNGNRTVARVTKPVVNGDVKEEDRALLEIPSLDPKEWAHDVKPLANPA